LEQAKAISFASAAPSKMRGLAEAGEMLADKHGIEAFFHQLLAGPSNGVDAGIEGGGDFAVPPSFASLRGISLQQNACLAQLPGRVLAGTYQRVEPFPLLIG
jgi:hypothetical protein